MPFGIHGPETDNTEGNNPALPQGYGDALDRESDRLSSISATALLRSMVDPAPPGPPRANRSTAIQMLRRQIAFVQQSRNEESRLTSAAARMSEGAQATAPLRHRLRNAPTSAAQSLSEVRQPAAQTGSPQAVAAPRSRRLDGIREAAYAALTSGSLQRSDRPQRAAPSTRGYAMFNPNEIIIPHPRPSNNGTARRTTTDFSKTM